MIKVVSGADGFDIKKNKSTIRKATSAYTAEQNHLDRRN